MKGYELKQAFSEEEGSRILAKLNSASQSELQEYPAVTNSMAVTMVKQRQNEPFDCFDKLLTLKGFGPKRVLYLGQNILQNIKRMTKQTRGIPNVAKKNIYPSYMKEEKPDSLIAMCLKLPHLFWIHMNKDYMIEDWDVVEMVQEGKYDHVIVQDQIWRYITGLPTTDVYLIEELLVNPRYLPYLITAMKTETALITLLNCAATLDGAKREVACGKIQQRVHKIKPGFLSRYFNVNVGGERESLNNIVRQILNSRYEGIPVTCDYSTKMKYLSLKGVQREHMGSCLLQAVLFYKLLEDPSLTTIPQSDAARDEDSSHHPYSAKEMDNGYSQMD